VVVEAIRFPAGAHVLNGELAYPESHHPQHAVVLAGPHPLLGGTMHNNVVRGLGDGLARHGAVTLRFNYHGLGATSDGALAHQLIEFWHRSRTPEEKEQIECLRAAVACVRSVAGATCPLALIGYSFGCTLLAGAAEDGAALVLIAPATDAHELDDLAALGQPKLVIAPHADFAATDDRLLDWFEALRGPKELLRPRLDGHFFRGFEGWLTSAVVEFLDRQGRCCT
jgi:alpha/beta superfamily hydrolase